MPKKLFVTGLDGFVGTNLRQVLLQEYWAHRFVLTYPQTKLELTDPDSVNAVVQETMPDMVIHLAAQSFVPLAITNPAHTYEVNFLGTLNLLDALKKHGFSGRFLYVSSGDVYGMVPSMDLPVKEDNPLKPCNPYSVSKAAAELLCSQWVRSYDFDVIIARPFNHMGPGQADSFVISNFAKQISEIKYHRRSPEISVGSIDVTRDFTDVRDVIHAYFLLLEKGRKGEIYNISSEKEQSIKDMLNHLVSLARVDCTITTDTSKVRPNEQKRMCGSYEKLKQETGWKPQIEVQTSLLDILNYWEQKILYD